jgi:hypothetical protein
MLVNQAADPAAVPFVLHSGRLVMLDAYSPLYMRIEGVESYWLDGPVPFVPPHDTIAVKP